MEQVLAEVEKDRVFYGTVGGMTLSGGEPMAQPAFALALLSGAREKGISTCIETSGAFPTKYIPELAANCDFFYYDVKDTDPERHRRNTGASLPRILQNLAALSSLAPRRVTMRCIIIAGINDNDAHLKQLLAIADRCGIEKIDLLPFHPMGSGKYGAVGQEAPVDFGEERIPDKGALEQMRRQITAHFAQRQ